MHVSCGHEEDAPSRFVQSVEPPTVLGQLPGAATVPRALVLDGDLQVRIGEVEAGDEPVIVEDPVLGAGLPAPRAQHRIFDDDGFIARVDFAYPDLKIAIEYEGAWHGRPGQLAKDRGRLNRLYEAGWRVFFVTAADMHDPDGLIRSIARALAW